MKFISFFFMRLDSIRLNYKKKATGIESDSLSMRQHKTLYR